MFSSFGEFINCIKEARFTFDVIWQAIVSFFTDVLQSPDVSAVWNGFLDLIAPVFNIALICGIVLSLVIALFGKKLIGVIKFLAFFALGFLLGAHYLTPLLPPEIALPGWIVGIVSALILGVLSRFIYIAVYVASVGYSAYLLTYHGFLLTPNPEYTNTRALVSLGVALVIIVLLLVFKKYVEMLGTAALGSFLAVTALVRIYDFTAWPLFDGIEWLASLIVMGVLTLITFIFQVKTRRRY